MAVKWLKCPNCASLISNKAIKEQNRKRGWSRPFFNRPVQCTDCGVFLKLKKSFFFLGMLFFVVGIYSLLSEESLAKSLVVIGLLAVLGLAFRLGISHKIVNETDV